MCDSAHQPVVSEHCSHDPSAVVHCLGGIVHGHYSLKKKEYKIDPWKLGRHMGRTGGGIHEQIFPSNSHC